MPTALENLADRFVKLGIQSKVTRSILNWADTARVEMAQFKALHSADVTRSAIGRDGAIRDDTAKVAHIWKTHAATLDAARASNRKTGDAVIGRAFPRPEKG
jgi:hypothetical protein